MGATVGPVIGKPVARDLGMKYPIPGATRDGFSYVTKPLWLVRHSSSATFCAVIHVRTRLGVKSDRLPGRANLFSWQVIDQVNESYFYNLNKSNGYVQNSPGLTGRDWRRGTRKGQTITVKADRPAVPAKRSGLR